MLFCGQDELSAAIQTGQSRPKSDQISALFSKGYIESRLGNNGNCTSANLKQQGVCFCDDADYCNSKASIFVALNYILILMVSVIVLMQ